MKFTIKGRLNGNNRSKSIVFKRGLISLNNYNIKIIKGFNEFITKDGIYSLQLLLFLKNVS